MSTEQQEMALDLGHAGAARAGGHADRTIPGWSDLALAALLRFAVNHPMFTIEEVRLASPGVPPPPDRRAWGNVAVRARRANLVVASSWVNSESKTGHGPPVTLWRRL